MLKPTKEILLTAAECAARTGLSARALRLYEEQGLLAPRRSPGGWRLYGSEDLVRLNAITLLKTAGLSLAQIGSVIDSGESGPDLARLLTIQRDNWRTRRMDAELGQRIAEAALERLGKGEWLTVDDLCDLIRSLEMGPAHDPAGNEPSTQEGVPVDAARLDQFVGQYRLGEWSIQTVKRQGSKLLLERPTGPDLELKATGDNDFEIQDVVTQAITFERNSAGGVQFLRLRMKGGDFVAERVDDAAAGEVRARLSARIRDQQPLPGSAESARRLVEGLIRGQPNYDAMHPALAHVARLQLHRLHTAAAFLGDIKSIEFQGVGAQGWDVYDVVQERGTSRVRLIQRSDGLLTGALYMVKDGPISIGP